MLGRARAEGIPTHGAEAHVGYPCAGEPPLLRSPLVGGAPPCHFRRARGWRGRRSLLCRAPGGLHRKRKPCFSRVCWSSTADLGEGKRARDVDGLDLSVLQGPKHTIFGTACGVTRRGAPGSRGFCRSASWRAWSPWVLSTALLDQFGTLLWEQIDAGVCRCVLLDTGTPNGRRHVPF